MELLKGQTHKILASRSFHIFSWRSKPHTWRSRVTKYRPWSSAARDPAGASDHWSYNMAAFSSGISKFTSFLWWTCRIYRFRKLCIDHPSSTPKLFWEAHSGQDFLNNVYAWTRLRCFLRTKPCWSSFGSLGDFWHHSNEELSRPALLWPRG